MAHYDAKIKAEEEREERKRLDAIKREEVNKMVREVLAHPAGRRYVLHILSKAEVFTVTNATNATIYTLEGKRMIGRDVLDEIQKAAPNELSKLIGEYYEQRGNDSGDRDG